MKSAICYYSYHHQNTLKVIEAMTEGYPVDLVDITQYPKYDLSHYDLIGFASGIYGFNVHQALITFTQQNLPRGKKLFFVYTYGLYKGLGSKDLAKIAQEREASILGEYSCRGYDTFGPLKFLGGIAKNHPNEQDLSQAKIFFHNISHELFL